MCAGDDNNIMFELNYSIVLGAQVGISSSSPLFDIGYAVC